MVLKLFGDKSCDCLVGHLELHRLLAGKLLDARLLCIEVVKSWLTRKDFATFGDLEAFGK